MSSPFYQRMYAEGKIRKVVGLPLAIAPTSGICSGALANRYQFDTSLEIHFIIAFVIFFIGLWIGYNSERYTGKK